MNCLALAMSTLASASVTGTVLIMTSLPTQVAAPESQLLNLMASSQVYPSPFDRLPLNNKQSF